MGCRTRRVVSGYGLHLGFLCPRVTACHDLPKAHRIRASNHRSNPVWMWICFDWRRNDTLWASREPSAHMIVLYCPVLLKSIPLTGTCLLVQISSRMAQGAFRSFLRSREYRWMVKTDAVSRYAVEQSKKQESRHREAQRMEAQSRVVKTKMTTAGGSAVESKRDPVGEAAQEEDISSGSDADDTDYSPSSDDTDTDDDTDD